MAKGLKDGKKNTLEMQIATLRKDMPQEKQDQAANLAKSDAAVVKLAFKLLERPNGKVDGLSKGQWKTYNQILNVSNKVTAEKWKKDVIEAGKAAKSSETETAE